MVTQEEAKERWRKHTKPNLKPEYANSFKYGEVWGEFDNGDPCVVSPDGEFIVCFTRTDTSVIAYFPECFTSPMEINKCSTGMK
jgi:hypothetical protein